jgi:hypothetical protein
MDTFFQKELTEDGKSTALSVDLVVWLGESLPFKLAQHIPIVNLPPNWHGICEGLGKLYTNGVCLNWLQFYQPDTVGRVPLPNYPFNNTPLNFNDIQSPTIMDIILNPTEKSRLLTQQPTLLETPEAISQPPGVIDTDEITEYLLKAISRKANVAAKNFSMDTRFEEMGMDSIMKVELSYDIMARLPELEQAGNALLEVETVNEFIEIIRGLIKTLPVLYQNGEDERPSFSDFELLHASQKIRPENLVSRWCRVENQTLTADLIVNEQHQFFFDHPLDHVSGVHQLEAMIQAVTTAHHTIGSQDKNTPVYLKDIHVDYKYVCPKTGIAQIAVHPVEFTEGCSNSELYTAHISNGKKNYCNAFFKLQPVDSDLESIPSKTAPSENCKFTACEKSNVNKSETMNVFISDPISSAGQMEGMIFDLRPLGDHPYFSDYPGNHVPSIYFLEAFRQTLRYLQMMQPDAASKTAESSVNLLLSLTLSLNRIVGRHEAVQIKIDQVQPKSVGRNLLVTATGRIMQDQLTLGFCKNRNMVLTQES